MKATTKRLYSVTELIAQARSPNTRRAYQGDLANFRRWGGKLPCTAGVVARYMASCLPKYKPSTIRRRVAAISVAHGLLGVRSPTSSPIVRATWRGILRTVGAVSRRAQPITIAQLKTLHKTIQKSKSNRSAKLRDWAIFAVGFAGAFRRSEIGALRIESVSFSRAGATLSIGNSKGVLRGARTAVAIPTMQDAACPVAALKLWLRHLGRDAGPLFPRLDRYGNIHANKAMSGEALNSRLKCWMARAGMDVARYSAHSLRAGLITAAAKAGVPLWKIKEQSRHRSDAALSIYIRDIDIWCDNAAAAALSGRYRRGSR